MQKLPVVTNTVIDVAAFSSEKFKDNITIVGFLGLDVSQQKGNALNLNQKIYKRFQEFEDFQFLMVQPKGTEESCQQLVDELSRSTQVDTTMEVCLFGSYSDSTGLRSTKHPIGIG